MHAIVDHGELDTRELNLKDSETVGLFEHTDTFFCVQALGHVTVKLSSSCLMVLEDRSRF